MVWYHIYNLKNVKNTHGGAIPFVKFRLKLATLLKVALLHGCFTFLNSEDGIKSCKASYDFEVALSVQYSGIIHIKTCVVEWICSKKQIVTNNISRQITAESLGLLVTTFLRVLNGNLFLS